jgi:hypothetical protein
MNILVALFLLGVGLFLCGVLYAIGIEWIASRD